MSYQLRPSLKVCSSEHIAQALSKYPCQEKCNHVGAPFHNGGSAIGLGARNGFMASGSPSNKLGSGLSSTRLELNVRAGAR